MPHSEHFWSKYYSRIRLNRNNENENSEKQQFMLHMRTQTLVGIFPWFGPGVVCMCAACVRAYVNVRINIIIVYNDVEASTLSRSNLSALSAIGLSNFVGVFFSFGFCVRKSSIFLFGWLAGFDSYHTSEAERSGEKISLI